jgi:chromosome segregation ATPase
MVDYLELEVSDLEKVAEHLRQYYVQVDEDDDDSGYKLNEEGVNKVLANYGRLLGEKKRLGKRLRDLEAKGVDANELAGLQEELAARDETIAQLKEKAEKGKGSDKEWEAREAQLVAKHEQEKQVLVEENDSLLRDLNENLIDRNLTDEIVALKGRPKAIIPYARKFVKIQKNEAGRRVPVVVDEEGNERVGDSKGTAMSIGQFVKEDIRSMPDFAPLFDDEEKGGGGAPPKGGTGGSLPKMDTKRLEGLSPTEKLKAAREASS